MIFSPPSRITISNKFFLNKNFQIFLLIEGVEGVDWFNKLLIIYWNADAGIPLFAAPTVFLEVQRMLAIHL